nr:hypothetical protein [Tanacetum cinerariifolium]
VEPTEVRKQSGLVREAFEEHKNKESAGKWREALKEAADLAGWELKKTTNGADEKLVGMEMRINDILSSLKIGVQDVLMIGIKWIGGARGLCGASNWFKPGSRIIITTRDKQVLLAYRVNIIHSFVHKINLLSADEAICLFSWYAFGREIPIEEYKNLSGEVVKYANGLPLTIKVLGSFLCGQDELEWKDALGRLKTIPLEATMEKLEISCLEADYKEIFLDISCLLEGWHIVRRLHPDEPRRYSRLWIDEEIKDILANDLEFDLRKCLCEYVSFLIISAYEFYLDVVSFNAFSDEVVFRINVLASSVKDWILH